MPGYQLAVIVTAIAIFSTPFAMVRAESEGLLGTYVGSARVEDVRSGETEQRDVDIVIENHKGDGLAISWINVSLVDGRRDVPGVTRRVQKVFFIPSSHGDFLEQASAYNPFETANEDPTPISGEPVLWAALDGDQLVSHSFVILDDGRYEMQIYRRSVEGDKLTLEFERIVDGEVRRVIEGHAIRTD